MRLPWQMQEMPDTGTDGHPSRQLMPAGCDDILIGLDMHMLQLALGMMSTMGCGFGVVDCLPGQYGGKSKLDDSHLEGL